MSIQATRTRLEIVEGDKRGFEIRIKGDMYNKARAVIYDEWIAKELAADLGIAIHYNKVNSRYEGSGNS
jgi:hypothetical protein